MEVQGKICPSCGAFRAYRFYYKDSQSADGYRKKCKVCERVIHKAAHDKAFKGIVPFVKECKICHRLLEPDMFARDPTKVDGLHPYCKECTKSIRLLEGKVTNIIERPNSRNQLYKSR